MSLKVKLEKKKIKVELTLSPREVALAIYDELDHDEKLDEKTIKKFTKRDIKDYLSYACEETLPLLGHFKDDKLGKLLTDQVKKRFK